MPEVPYTYKGITDEELEIEDRMRDQAGAGRGKQGGPTAKELADYERKQNEGIYTAEMGKPPQDIDGRSAKKKVVKKAGGGMTASRRGDGIAQRGKTRGKMC
jgi:hypothetical protein